MSRFHIDSNGRPAECRAQPGNCPKKLPDGTPSPHFETAELASQWNETHRNDETPTIVSGFNFSYEPLDEDLFLDDLDVPDVKIDETGSEIPANEATIAEEQAIEALAVTEGEIVSHQNSLKRGAKPIDLYNSVRVDDMVRQFIDMKDYKRSFLNGDYDRVRHLAARAARRAYGNLGTMYFDEDELIARAQKEYDEEYGYI